MYLFIFVFVLRLHMGQVNDVAVRVRATARFERLKKKKTLLFTTSRFYCVICISQAPLHLSSPDREVKGRHLASYAGWRCG